MNLGDISTSSFGTPLPAKATPDLDDSPITQPRFNAGDDESEDGQDSAPPSPLDDRTPAKPKEANVEITSQRIPGRDQTPKADPEPQTPSRRQKIQITMETETVVVSTQPPFLYDMPVNPGVKAKVWATIGDLIQPGYQYPGEGRTLRAKETMCAPPFYRP